MKITKRQLRRIIREERDAILEGPGRRKYGKGRHYNAFGQKIYKSPAPKKSIDHRFVYEYEMWVEDFGQGAENPSHPGVMASYFLEKGLEDDHEKHEALGNLYGVDHEDIMKELKLQLAQVPLPLEESKMKITKRQLRRIIKEEKAKLVSEAPASEFGIFDQYYLTNMLMEEVESFMDQVGVESFGPAEVKDMQNAVMKALDTVTKQVSQ